MRGCVGRGREGNMSADLEETGGTRGGEGDRLEAQAE